MGESRKSWSGRVRVFFNRKADAPLVWSVDDGDQANEMVVKQVVFRLLTTPWKTVFVEREDRTWPAPAGWIEGAGFVEVKDDIAEIWG